MLLSQFVKFLWYVVVDRKVSVLQFEGISHYSFSIHIPQKSRDDHARATSLFTHPVDPLEFYLSSILNSKLLFPNVS